MQAPLVADDNATAFIPVAGVPATETTSTQVITTGPRPEDPPAQKRRTAPLILLGLLLAALVAAAAIFGPKLLDSSPPQTAVPTIVGMTQAQAEATLKENGLTVGNVSQEASDTIEKGRVISQNPSADESVDPATAIDFAVSSGKPDVTIPDVVGDNKDSAADQLRALGLRVKLKGADSDENKDDVISVNPDVGTPVAANSVVTLTFSNGPKAVPNVVGKTEAQATRILQDAGFKVSSLPDTSSTDPKGTVTQQSPQAGGPQPSGTTITILVSTYEPPPPPTPTPTPTETPTGLPTP